MYPALFFGKASEKAYPALRENVFAVVPFNLLKGVLVSLLTFFLYKRVEKLFFRKKHTA